MKINKSHNLLNPFKYDKAELPTTNVKVAKKSK